MMAEGTGVDEPEKEDLRDFEIRAELGNDPSKKFASIEGRFSGDSSTRAILTLEKSPFTLDEIHKILGSSETRLETVVNNDIYRQISIQTEPGLCSIKANLIYPATQKHLDKFTFLPHNLIQETPALYNSLTRHYLEKSTFSLDWVYNILEHKKEQEFVVLDDLDPETGFILLKDFKWDEKNIQDLHVLAIVRKRGLKSLRTLNEVHLPLLRNIYEKGLRGIYDKYGVPASKLRAYFHYQPSYYHLHVHFSHISYDMAGIRVERAHFLKNVISNIEIDSRYYEKATLTFSAKENDKLFLHYKEAGYSFGPLIEEKFDMNNLVEFFKLLGQAKHEPCGEHWLMTYGESAWRMAMLCLCLPSTLDRSLLCKISLTSSFTCFGSKTDQNSQWVHKEKEVKEELFRLLPLSKATELYDMYSFHVAARLGRNSNTELGGAYRGVLEVEETFLQTEELMKEGGITNEEVDKVVIDRLCKAKFSGYEKYELFKDDSELKSTLKFIQRISALTKLKRAGWVQSGIQDPETVSSHMFRMAVMCILLSSNYEIRNGGAVIISLIHDLAECIVGDITPIDGVSDFDKNKQEMAAMKDLTRSLRSDLSYDIFKAFERYENKSDYEAILTKDIDKFDMIFQAFEYETSSAKKKSLQSFFDSTVKRNVFVTETVKTWVDYLCSLRNAECSC